MKYPYKHIYIKNRLCAGREIGSCLHGDGKTQLVLLSYRLNRIKKSDIDQDKIVNENLKTLDIFNDYTERYILIESPSKIDQDQEIYRYYYRSWDSVDSIIAQLEYYIDLIEDQYPTPFEYRYQDLVALLDYMLKRVMSVPDKGNRRYKHHRIEYPHGYNPLDYINRHGYHLPKNEWGDLLIEKPKYQKSTPYTPIITRVHVLEVIQDEWDDFLQYDTTPIGPIDITGL